MDHFVIVAVLYTGLGVTTVLILRKMTTLRGTRLDESEVPYGPREPLAETPGARSWGL